MSASPVGGGSPSRGRGLLRLPPRVWGPLLLALCLRLPGIGFGLPEFSPERDEILVVESAIGMFGGSWRPIDFRYPPLFATLVRIAQQPVAWWLEAAGIIEDGPGTIAYFAARPTAFYIAGRLLALVSGLATVWLAGRLGASLGGPSAGLLAALVLAIAPLHVEMSRIARVDAALAMWTTAALVAAVEHARRPSRRSAIATGLLTGLAVGTKYSGVCLLPLCAAVACRPLEERHRLLRTRPRRVLVLLAIPFAVLLLANPALVAWLPEAVQRAAWLPRFVVQRFNPAREPGYILYPRELVGASFGAGLLAASAVGGVRLVRRREPGSGFLFLFVAVYSALFLFAQTAYDRFLLPLIPVLAAIAAVGIAATARALSLRPALVLFVAAVPSLPFLVSRVVTTATSGHTWLRLVHRIEREVPPGRSVLILGIDEQPLLVDQGAPAFDALLLLNPAAALGRERYAIEREKALAFRRQLSRPSYRLRRVGAETWRATALRARPGAIVALRELPTGRDAAPPEGYTPWIAFEPGWFCRGAPHYLSLREDLAR